MKVLITGGSGYLGRALTKSLEKESLGTPVEVYWVSRDKNIERPHSVVVLTYDELKMSKSTFDIIVNLAGAGVADARWSPKRKKLLLDSRLKPTQAVLDYIQQAEVKPQLFISGSAIGWYGVQDNPTPLSESSPCVCNDYPHQLCDAWENLAKTALEYNTQLAIIRTGVVMSGDISDGGMMARLKLPFSLGLGGQLGDGTQMMSWISRHDWVRAVEFIITHNVNNKSIDNTEQQQTANQYNEGQVYNLTAPQCVTNKQFTKAVGTWLNRPTFFRQPEFVLSALLGEMSTLLFDGQNVVPNHLLELGFEFHDTNVSDVFKRS